MIRLLFLSLFLFITCFFHVEAKKIKNTFKIEKESKKKNDNTDVLKGKMINLNDSLSPLNFENKSEIQNIYKVSFAGYEKEAASSKESFLMINPSSYNITAFEVKINYYDLQGRMLHSRIVKEICDLPAGETRRFDIKSWDTQHTYYYHLGNEPKKVSIPYKVSFLPLLIWVEE